MQIQNIQNIQNFKQSFKGNSNTNNESKRILPRIYDEDRIGVTEKGNKYIKSTFTGPILGVLAPFGTIMAMHKTLIKPSFESLKETFSNSSGFKKVIKSIGLTGVLAAATVITGIFALATAKAGRVAGTAVDNMANENRAKYADAQAEAKNKEADVKIK